MNKYMFLQLRDSRDQLLNLYLVEGYENQGYSKK